MAILGGRVCISSYGTHIIHVFDLSGVHMYTFGKKGKGMGEFCAPMRLCAHPNGNLLVLECHNRRVQEVTRTGVHARFAAVHGQTPNAVAVSPDGSVVAVAAINACGQCSIALLDGSTCVPTQHLGTVQRNVYDIQFSPDCTRVVIATHGHRPLAFTMNGDGGWEKFGAAGRCRRVEFTNAGDIVLCNRHDVCVHSGKTLEPLRSWALPARDLKIWGLQAHGDVLYVLYNAAGTSVPVLCTYK